MLSNFLRLLQRPDTSGWAKGTGTDCKVFSRLSEQGAGLPIQKGQSCLAAGVVRQGVTLNAYQESVTSDAIDHTVELFPQLTDCSE